LIVSPFSNAEEFREERLLGEAEGICAEKIPGFEGLNRKASYAFGEECTIR